MINMPKYVNFSKFHIKIFLHLEEVGQRGIQEKREPLMHLSSEIRKYTQT